jgi:hypothetical protein
MLGAGGKMLLKASLWLAPLFFCSATAGAADLRDIQYGAAHDWILPSPSISPVSQQSDAPFRILYQDTEERISSGGTDTFSAYRVKILKPEALTLGNVNVLWVPSSGPATVHYVRIIRDGHVIDVLAQTKFKIVEREANLEQSMLDGALTATLQVPGLQVGDELEFAGTIRHAEPALGGHVAGLTQLAVVGLPGTFRYRLVWPDSEHLTWRATKDLPPAVRTTAGASNAIVVQLRDPPLSADVEGAPSRYNVRRVIEYTDYSSWNDLSRQLWPLFDQASKLSPNSPLRAEAAKIASSFSDETDRAQAALRLVEDQIRYVYVGLDGANYRPATADETWQRRFGDCKAKVVVLSALLKELGIDAVPALVNSKGGDGTNERLPSPAVFDHAVVRASIGGHTFWLDGTRLGDRYFDVLPPPSFSWALPLRAAGAELEPVPATISKYPQYIALRDIDATAGISKEAKIAAKDIFHGNGAFEIKSQLTSLSPLDADRAVKAYWRQQADWVTPDSVDWHYDERHNALVLSITGVGKIDWEGDDREGHSYNLPGAGFTPPSPLKRPADQDQNAGWVVEYPRFRCWATTIHLPPAVAGRHWSYSSDPVDRRLGGVIYWRAAGMSGNIVRTVMSRQSYTRDISAAEAAQVNDPKPPFDNYMSSVDESSSSSKGHQVSNLPFSDAADWLGDPAPCSPPTNRN